MQEKMMFRLEELKSEYQKGQEQLQNLEQEIANIKASMLRISGAIQVLEELLADQNNDRKVNNETSEMAES